MKFSICIPNFNYARYLRATIDSALSQEEVELEVVVADNASTDGSRELLESYRGDSRVRWMVNRCNVGFARNLDKAVSLATGDVLILLSSDDLILPGALATYRRLLDELGPERSRTAVVSSGIAIVDAAGSKTGEAGAPNRRLWHPADRIRLDGRGVQQQIYRADGPTLLRRCLEITETPFNFLTAAYSRELYEAVEGYGGGRHIAPDKWFHWRLLARPGTEAFYIDAPLFAYRVHASNQLAGQKRSGALKSLLDEYADTFEIDEEALRSAGMSREELRQAFLHWDVVRQGVQALAEQGRSQAMRMYLFGRAAYPQLALRDPWMWAFRLLLATGPLARPLARATLAFVRSRASS